MVIFSLSKGFTSWTSLYGTYLLSINNHLFIGLFDIFMFPSLILASVIYINIYLFGTPCNIDRIREPVAGSLLFGNNIVSGSLIPSSNAIGLHFYPIWITSSLYDWLYNGGLYQFMILHLVIGVSGWIAREWEFSYRLSIRSWIYVAFSSPVVASFAVFMIYYPIKQDIFS